MTHAELPLWGRGYVATVAVLGIAALTHSVYSVVSEPIGGLNWFVLAALTVLTGSATVKLPSVPATISISETFVFTSALLYGPAAGTLTVALDALVISYSLARKGHPAYRVLFNVCALPASLWVGAHIFFWSADLPPLSTLPDTRDSLPIWQLTKSLVLFTACYFALNSWLIAIAIAIEKSVSPLRVWTENFAWLSLNYFGGASVAALLVLYSRNLEFGFLAIVLPLLGVLYFTFFAAMGRVEDTNKHLSQLNAMYMSTIETLAMAIDAKDQITHGHIRRVQHYAVALAKRVGINDRSQINAIEAASLLHDMGKLAVPEYILNKPGPLTPAEFEKMKLHSSVGADILSAIDFPYPVVPIVRHHHENWDGSGYPDGLSGAAIPIGARILSVVDCFDALTSDRPYRPRLPDTDAVRILKERRGKMYDPLVVDTFVAIYAEIAPTSEQQAVPAKDGLSAITRGLSRHQETTTSARRFDEINASTEEMLSLYDLAKSLAGRINFSDAADIIAKHLRRMIPASTFVFFLFDEEMDELAAGHAAGEHASHFAGLRIARGQRLSGWVAANLRSVLNSDPVLDLGEVARSVRPPLRGCLSTPLLSADELVGVLTAYSTQRDAFSEDHQRILEAVARQVGQTLKHAVIFDRERQERLRDHITGLPNLQQLERFIAAELRTPNAGELAIILIEIRSGIRSTTPTDTVISSIAEIVRQGLGGADVLFRYSESALIVLMTSSDRRTAIHVAEGASERLSSFVAPAGAVAPSATFGVATAPADGLTLPDLVDAAKNHPVARPPRNHPPSVH